MSPVIELRSLAPQPASGGLSQRTRPARLGQFQRFGRLLVFGGALLGLSSVSSISWSQSEGSAGPGKGSGQRRAEADDAASDDAGNDPASEGASKAFPSVEKSEAAKPEKKLESHRRGPAPGKPNSTLPSDAPKAEQNLAARRGIAETNITADAHLELDDEEIQALLRAERVLFPKPLIGATPGWSWGLPQKTQPSAPGGLPPSGPSELEPSSGARPGQSWLAQLILPNFGVRLDPRVVTYLEFYKTNPRGQAIARAWAKKSGRFVPALQAALAKAGMPTDLVWLSLIESGHNPTIYSSAGAAGLWQFIPDTGRTYGLTVDRWVDERLDPQRSTDAALGYLADLHKRFGNWELAMAGYNMGHGGLSRAIRKYNTNDYWELSRYEAGIPWETALYVPKIAAIAIVMNNKPIFGIADIKPDLPESFDTLQVPGGVTLEQVAKAAGVTKDQIEALNPHYLAGRLPPTDGKPASSGEKAEAALASARWRVKIPRGKGEQARVGLSHVAPIQAKYSPYVVRFGDTAEAIAAESGMTEASLRQLNTLGRGEVLQAGHVLLVPKSRAASVKAAKEVVVVPPRPFNYKGRKQVFYRTIAGDSLEAVAAAFNVSRAEIISWNGLDTQARLLTGMALQLFVKSDFELSTVRLIEAPEVLIAGTDPFFDYFEAQMGRKRIRVKVQAGDTLAKIGQRYGMSIGMMERINRMSRSTQLKVGDSLVVYAKANDSRGNESSVEDGVERLPLPPVNTGAAP